MGFFNWLFTSKAEREQQKIEDEAYAKFVKESAQRRKELSRDYYKPSPRTNRNTTVRDSSSLVDDTPYNYSGSPISSYYSSSSCSSSSSSSYDSSSSSSCDSGGGGGGGE